MPGDEKVLTRRVDERQTWDTTSSLGEPPDCGRIANAPWFVVHTHHRAEHIAARELADAGYPHHLPLQAVSRRVNGVATLTMVPLFSQYLFVQLPHGMSAANVRYLPGVRNLFSTPAMKPIPVPGGFVERLMAEAPARLHLVTEALPVLAKGATVQATQGPLTGLMGSVVSCDGVLSVVDMALFGRVCHTQMRRVDLEVVA